uniref:Uncharacterized protein n=1 Tax=Zea mays TaxID=4577 RepID=A0A804NZE9_MAIZE
MARLPGPVRVQRAIQARPGDLPARRCPSDTQRAPSSALQRPGVSAARQMSLGTSVEKKVLVFDDFPTVRRQKTRWQGPARVHPRPEPWRCCLPSSTVAIVTDSTKIAAVPAAPTAVANVQKSARADIPQDPKASLCRFLRRERIDVTPVKEIVEGQAWLRLGPQIANPDLSQ